MGLPMTAAETIAEAAPADPAPALLEVRGVRKTFGGLQALAGCSFSVAEREIVGLIGPNGSGKTTLFNIIAGYLPQDGGSVRFRGQDLQDLRPFQIARRGIARTFQVTRIFPKMTLLENLILPAGAGHRRAKARELLDLVGLADLEYEYANDLSFGQQRLLSIVQVLMLDPTLILLDEPAAGVNPTMQNRIVALMRQLNAAGKTFLIIEHNMDLVMNNCSRVIVLNMGGKIAEGTPQEVRRNEAVLAAYFGA
jgi:branched-chain amino acid transport system ATP-binding protein/branched-chain amino acid transport system permease protein